MYEHQNTYDTQFLRSRRQRPARPRAFFLLIICIIGIFLFIFFTFSNKKDGPNGELISPLAQILSASDTAVPAESESKELKAIVQSALEGSKGTYGIAIKNLKTNEYYYFNEHHSFETASLYKLWVMAVTVRQLEEGKLQADQTLSADVVDLNKRFNIASESAELTEGSISFSVKSALEQMITISHNYAALLLSSKVKLATVKEFLKNHNLNESHVGTTTKAPTATAFDMMVFMEKLYNGEFGSEDSKVMIDLLKRQKLNNKLPKYLPEDIVVAHKTGELGWFTHDAGIVYTPAGNYLIAVMSESTAPAVAEDRIATISKLVYDHFTEYKE